MTVTEAQKRATNKYKSAKWHRVPFDVPNEFYDKIKACADASGESVNGYIRNAIVARMKSEGLDI